MKNMWNFVIAMSRPTIGLIIAAIVIFGLMTFKLGSLTPGLSEPEIITYNSASSISHIVDNSVNAPYKIAVYASTSVLDTAFGLRIVGALVGVLSVTTFYIFVRKLLSPLVAISTTALFASSSVLLSTARLASPEVMLLTLLGVIAVGFMIRFHKNSTTSWIIAAVILSLAVYVPGMAIFIALAAAFQFKHVRKSFEQLKPTTIIIVSAIVSIMLAPILINLIREPVLWREYLGLPTLLPTVTDFFKNMVGSVLAIFVVSDPDFYRHVGRQPMLDIFASIMFLYGFIVLIKQRKLDRFWTIFGILSLSIVWVSLSANQANLIVILPFIYLLAGIGIQNILNQWVEVFPRNPIARNVGYIVLVATVLLATNYQCQRYFNAWANSEETKVVFNKQLPQ